jgi:hypothetical protein
MEFASNRESLSKSATIRLVDQLSVPNAQQTFVYSTVGPTTTTTTVGETKDETPRFRPLAPQQDSYWWNQSHERVMFNSIVSRIMSLDSIVPNGGDTKANPVTAPSQAPLAEASLLHPSEAPPPKDDNRIRDLSSALRFPNRDDDWDALGDTKDQKQEASLVSNTGLDESISPLDDDDVPPLEHEDGTPGTTEYSAIHRAAWKGCKARILKLVAAGESINRLHEGWTPLSWALTDVAKARLVLECRADPNLYVRGQTAMMECLRLASMPRTRRLQLIQTLLEFHANPELPSRLTQDSGGLYISVLAGETPLAFARRHGLTKIVRLLEDGQKIVKPEPAPDAPSPFQCRTCLQLNCQCTATATRPPQAPGRESSDRPLDSSQGPIDSAVVSDRGDTKMGQTTDPKSPDLDDDDDMPYLEPAADPQTSTDEEQDTDDDMPYLQDTVVRTDGPVWESHGVSSDAVNQVPWTRYESDPQPVPIKSNPTALVESRPQTAHVELSSAKDQHTNDQDSKSAAERLDPDGDDGERIGWNRMYKGLDLTLVPPTSNAQDVPTIDKFNLVDSWSWYRAVREGDIKQMEEWVHKGASVNEQAYGSCPLTWAQMEPAAFRWLLQHGADPNTFVPQGSMLNPILIDCFVHRPRPDDAEPLVKMLLEFKANPSLVCKKNPVNSWWAYDVDERRNHPEYLPRQGETAVEYAKRRDAVKIAELLQGAQAIAKAPTAPEAPNPLQCRVCLRLNCQQHVAQSPPCLDASKITESTQGGHTVPKPESAPEAVQAPLPLQCCSCLRIACLCVD